MTVKGRTNNPRGRPKGTVNRSTERVRGAIAVFAEKHADDCFKWIERVAVDDPKGAFQCYMGLLEYHMPKIQRVEVTGKDGEQLKISSIISDITTSTLPSIDMVEEEDKFKQLMSHGIKDLIPIEDAPPNDGSK